MDNDKLAKYIADSYFKTLPIETLEKLHTPGYENIYFSKYIDIFNKALDEINKNNLNLGDNNMYSATDELKKREVFKNPFGEEFIHAVGDLESKSK